MRALPLLLLIVAGPAAAAPARPAPAAPTAPPPGSRAMTCPVGGASFQYPVPARPGPTVGERPDGKPYGPALPLPLPECPDNGLVMYKDYTPDEAAKLAPLVGSEAYQALRKEDVSYYRAYWLMKRMGLGPEDYLWVLLQASWQADDRPELRKRYLAELAEESGRATARPADLNWIGMEGRAVNALRELGRFDEAAARIEKVPLKSLDVAAPAAEDRGAAAQQARVKRAWLHYFQQMQTVLARKDSSLEPFELLPRAVAYGRCLDAAAALQPVQKAFCDAEQGGIEQFRIVRAKEAQELEALRRSREESGR
ncbi:MAG: hypothetical protein JOZ90_00550 [Alphaproteobacteria bacterium]|nr:hypothetical protein [Alphaproteobacteria bacterium]MBV9372275.1 hypothetical protein [Alphaproteobacteria bacterium]MBV9899567.1 hypothetical protein [Alphaproteobacteria bacterium]